MCELRWVGGYAEQRETLQHTVLRGSVENEQQCMLLGCAVWGSTMPVRHAGGPGGPGNSTCLCALRSGLGSWDEVMPCITSCSGGIT